jgi:hypothetical protein
MPTYVYEILDHDGKPTGTTFEYVQSMKDKPLSKHPTTGQPVRKCIVAPHIAGDWSPVKTKGKLSNKNLERMGFTKYERKGNGYMERVAGKEGPKTLGGD